MRVRNLLLLVVVAVVCAAGLIFVFSMDDGSTGAGNTSALRINEVMTSNKGAVPDQNGNFPDWIELYNSSESDLNISGFGLSDDRLTAAKWAFPAGTIIPAQGYVVVFCTGDPSDGNLYASFRLSATDDLLLSNSSGSLIDNLQLEPVTANTTLGKDESGAWVEMASPSPGYPNTTEGVEQYRATLQQDVQDNGVRINEFMASNATTLPGPSGDYPDWIELYNTTAAPVDISGCGLSDDKNSAMKWVFPEGTTIPANGFLTVYCSGLDGLIDGELHAPFGLLAYAEDVVFSGKNGAAIESYTYTPQEADRSMARMPDGLGAFVSTAKPTPGHPNTDEGYAAFSLTSILPKGPLSISEALGNNAATVINNDTPDWIEIHNGSNTAINLAGYALSDNPKNPAKWVFPDVSIGPDEYKLVLATGNNITDTQKKNLETNFGLSSDGDVLLLFSPEGELLDKLTLRNVGADISYGRAGERLLYFGSPTPGQPNNEGNEGVTAQPLFSLTPGIFDAPVELAISAPQGAKVYYTLDCNIPTASSTPYSEPIALSKNTVVRAVAVQTGFLTGASCSGTYLFRSDEVNHQLPVVTLVMDPDDLWNETTGIYRNGPDYDPDEELPFTTANYYKTGDAWERSAAFAIFDDDGRQVFSQNITARIAGSFGRRREQKGFNLMARASEGKSSMEYSFFENRPYESYKSLVLRAGAQDQSMSKIRDELSTGLLEGTDVNILHQAYKPYVLYLNGEYWGVYFLKEKRNRFFVAQHEGLSTAEQMDLIKSSTRVSYGSADGWTALMAYVNAHDLSSQSAYDHVAAQIDLDSFMDYMICEMYVANSDYWNIQSYQTDGGKWKWIYYDFCWSWGNTGSSAVSTPGATRTSTAGAAHPTVATRRDNRNPGSDLLNALLKNAQWKDKFVRRFAQLMQTVYDPARVNALVDELYASVEPEIKRERAKFNTNNSDANNIATYDGFLNQIEKIRSFANERPALIKGMLKSELGLSDAYMKEVFG